MLDMKKISFEFCSDTFKIISAMQSLYCLSNEADVIKKALSLLKTVSDLTEDGELVYKVGKKESKIVVHPNSQSKVALKIVQ